MGAVGGVDHLERVDGHLVEGHVHFLRLLNDDGSRGDPEEDGVLGDKK